jgi:hypothetical protein
VGGKRERYEVALMVSNFWKCCGDSPSMGGGKGKKDVNAKLTIIIL